MLSKQKPLCILKYLWEQTDCEHQVTLADISAYLSENDIEANRHTLMSDIAELIEFGFDIVTVRSRQNHYFLNNRSFELPELKLLVDAVQASRFITLKKSRELIKKLSRQASVHQVEQWRQALTLFTKCNRRYRPSLCGQN